jgi:ABC-2 type transport system permease protein
MALFRVELRRLLARRLTRVLAILALAGILISGTTVFFKSSNDQPTDTVTATVVSRNGHDYVRCSSPNGGFTEFPVPKGVDPSSAGFSCGSFGLSAPDPRFHLTDLHDVWLGVGGQLIIVAWLLGASFLGAEWHAGTITTTLTWEPRRVRVFLSKLAACVVVVFAGTILIELLLGAALLPAALFRGTTAGVDAAWAHDVAGVLLRAGAACGFGAALGYGIAAIGRNTAASLGAGFVYLVVIENLIRAYKPAWQGSLLGDNMAAFLVGPSDPVIPGRSIAEAAAIVALYGAISLLAGLALFRRKDVT